MVLTGQKLYLCKGTVADTVVCSKHPTSNLLVLTCLAIMWCHWTDSSKYVSNVVFPMEADSHLDLTLLQSLFPCYSDINDWALHW